MKKPSSEIYLKKMKKALSFVIFRYLNYLKLLVVHCVKIVQIWNFFWSVFSCIRTEYGDLMRKSPYSVRIQEIQTRKNSVFGHFSRSGCLTECFLCQIFQQNNGRSFCTFNWRFTNFFS